MKQGIGAKTENPHISIQVHVCVCNSNNTICTAAIHAAPPSGMGSIKATLVCPGYFQMALGLLLSFFSILLLFFPHMKALSADICSALRSLLIRNIKVSKSISQGSSAINGIHRFLICGKKLI